ncbi:hypothetical protein [Elizabethkingia anophelis]|uniref:hypothetical protein n=1 Tax=Elizabethkingia anophelis TaxID=1117645 RepID=UPI0013DE1F78|nr:hypothetical protein [Elizabethkingia anophelis]
MAIAPAFLLLGSCRSNDTDGSMASSGPAALNISLGGTDFGGTSDGGQASLGKEVRESRAVMLTPSTQAMIEVSSEPGMVKGSSKSGGVAVVPGDPLGPGNAFRVIAYRASNGSYQAHQDYIIGSGSTPMMLDGGASYTIVAYSYGSSTLPAISAGETTNLSSAVASYDDTNPDFMYQRQSVTPNGNVTTPLTIVLRHKLSLLTMTLNVTNLGQGRIAGITNTRILPHSTTGTINLSNGLMNRGTASQKSINFAGPFETTTFETSSDPAWINAQAVQQDPNGNINNMGRVLGEIRLRNDAAGVEITRNLTIPTFAITPERRQNVTVNFTTCGAFMGPGQTNFRAFKCHNEGADTSVNAFAPVAAIHGAKYQWGASTGQAGRYVSQADDQNISGPFPNWIGTPLSAGWTDTGGPNNPCGAGFHVPTSAEWQAVVLNNFGRRVGIWTNSITNFGSGIYIGATNNERLFLPNAGIRRNSDGQLENRGGLSFYWTSTLFNSTVQPPFASVWLRFGGTPDVYLGTSGRDRSDAASVRCISNN